MYANESSASGRRCWRGRAPGFPSNAVHKAELCSLTQLYPYARWNENDIHHFLKTVVAIRNTVIDKIPHWISILKRAVLNQAFSPPRRENFSRRDYLCDITNTGKQLCSPNEPFVVVPENGFKKNEISPFGVDFEICKFVDICLCPNILTAHWLKFSESEKA